MAASLADALLFFSVKALFAIPSVFPGCPQTRRPARRFILGGFVLHFLSEQPRREPRLFCLTPASVSFGDHPRATTAFCSSAVSLNCRSSSDSVWIGQHDKCSSPLECFQLFLQKKWRETTPPQRRPAPRRILRRAFSRLHRRCLLRPITLPRPRFPQPRPSLLFPPLPTTADVQILAVSPSFLPFLLRAVRLRLPLSLRQPPLLCLPFLPLIPPVFLPLFLLPLSLLCLRLPVPEIRRRAQTT